jgi:hypothetical protein
MKDPLKIRWWLHTVIVMVFAAVAGCLYYTAWNFTQLAPEHDLIIYRLLTVLLAVMACHVIWLSVLLVKVAMRKQFASIIFLSLFALADIGLIKAAGFLWAVITVP